MHNFNEEKARMLLLTLVRALADEIRKEKRKSNSFRNTNADLPFLNFKSAITNADARLAVLMDLNNKLINNGLTVERLCEKSNKITKQELNATLAIVSPIVSQFKAAKPSPSALLTAMSESDKAYYLKQHTADGGFIVLLSCLAKKISELLHLKTSSEKLLIRSEKRINRFFMH